MLDSELVRIIRDIEANTVTALSLRNKQLNNEQGIRIANALKNNTSIIALDLSYNELGQAAGRALLQTCQVNRTLRNLNLSNNTAGMLSKDLKPETLSEIEKLMQYARDLWEKKKKEESATAAAKEARQMKLDWNIQYNLTTFLKEIIAKPPVDLKSLKETIEIILSGQEEGPVQKAIEALECANATLTKENLANIWVLAFCYFHGIGVVKDEKKAVELFQLSVNQGNAYAQQCLGVCYLHGAGVVKDEKKAVELFQLSVNQGNALAQQCLGVCYRDGTGVIKDEKKAVELFQLSVNQGNAYGQCTLGLAYENGQGVIRDEKKAVEYYQLASRQGNALAQSAIERLRRDKPSLFISTSPASTPHPQVPITSAPSPNANAAIQPFSKQTPSHRSDPPSVFEVADRRDTKEKADFHVTASYEINYTDLTFGKELGKGGFGVVYQGTYRREEVAIKQLLIDRPTEDSSSEFESEVQVMAKLRSKYIVQFYGYCLNPKYSIVMEYMPKGSLFTLLRSNVPLDWTIRIQIATEMAHGLSVLHTENILHRDIKSLNVLLDEHLHAKLTDFGLAKIKNETRSSTKNVGGTLQWMAPELFKLRPNHTKKSDVFSLGITFWEIAARQIPYQGAADAVIRDSVPKGEREDIPHDCPKRLATIIQACWETDPLKRPEIDAVADFLKSNQEDFQAFLPVFLASRQSRGFTQAIEGNLASGADASSFNRGLAGNFDSARK